MFVRLCTILSSAALLAAVSGCSEGELILEGERLSPREAELALAQDGAPLEESNRAVAVALPGQISNADWTHVGGNAAHLAPNAAFSGALTRVWTANIGQGDSRRNRISADVIVSGGRVYTIDAGATVTATATNGGTAWQVDLTPATDRSNEASGGGLAAGEGLVFAATGFAELVALDPASGNVAWRQRFDAPVAGAPVVSGGKVFAVTREGTAWALDARDGRIAWQLPASTERTGVAGGSAPAVAGDTVIFPSGSGKLMAVDTSTGAPKWTGFAAGKRPGRAYAAYSDLTGEPVIAGQTVYTASAAGRMVALGLADGALGWAASDGAGNAVAVAGNDLFFVNDEAQLVRIDAATGATVWRVDMPYFTKDKERKRREIHAHYGPVLAGGRLITVSTDGLARAFDPASGTLVASAEIPGGAASAPAVAGGTLYVLSRSGQLHAFR